MFGVFCFGCSPLLLKPYYGSMLWDYPQASNRLVVEIRDGTEVDVTTVVVVGTTTAMMVVAVEIAYH
jgi:hypothetical protein